MAMFRRPLRAWQRYAREEKIVIEKMKANGGTIIFRKDLTPPEQRACTRLERYGKVTRYINERGAFSYALKPEQ